ncbi:MAG: hypothetical protein HY288_19885 [Planctomycetia bacterium]|nr:hypothetical protein [Planctomycetia bacterium]
MMPFTPLTTALSVDEVVREQFWRTQFPHLSIQSHRAQGFCIVNPPLMARIRERIMKEGYLDGQDDGLKQLATALAEGVERCVSLGIPPTFIFLFDEAWECFFRLHPVVSSLLGDGYRLLPDFWAWHVSPEREESGWLPHRDKGRRSLASDGAPLSLTLWLPLNEVTPLTSCIYLVPSNRDQTFNTPQEDQWRFDLPSIRALPAKPGEYLCWNQAVLHWGSRASPFATRPRMSMAMECQRGDIPAFNAPLLAPLVQLSFEQRLVLIAKQILQYRHMYALSPELEALAQRLVSS